MFWRPRSLQLYRDLKVVSSLSQVVTYKMRLLLLTVSVVSVFGREKQVKPKVGSKQATHSKAKLKVPRDHDYYNYVDYGDYYQVMRFNIISR